MNIEYREHIFTEGKLTAALEDLRSPPMPKEVYEKAHQGMVIPTHDAAITYNGEIILLERTADPLKGFLWFPGGRIMRGVPTEESLRIKVKSECGLDISDLEFAGLERAFMPTDPFGHKKGTDTIGPIYFAKGNGEIRLDMSHACVHKVNPLEYNSLRSKLHPFVKKYTDKLIERLLR